MVDLIREKISVTLPVKMTGGEKIKPEANNSDTNDSTVTKKILPLGLIAGGGLLIYYGVKGPNASKFVKKMVKDRISVIETRVSDFADNAKGYIWEQFRNADAPISEYIEQRVIHPQKFTKLLEKVNVPSDVLTSQDEAFELLQKEIYKDVRAGATDFDNFTSFLYSIRRSAGDCMNNKRHRTNLANGDLITLPQFKNGKRKKLLEKMSKQIDDKVKSSADEMLAVENEVFEKYIHEKSAKMAKAVTQKRDNFAEIKRLLLDDSFAKVRQSMGLGEEFVPMYNQIPTLENFSKLTKSELKPQNLPDGVEHIFNGTMFGEILKTQDFSKLDDESLRIIFLKMLHVQNVQDIGIMADRLRLKAVVDGNKDLYRVSIAKLEFLQNKLQEAGEKELFKRLQIDFTDMTAEQKRARFAYINDAGRRLGFNNLEQMHNSLSVSHPEYLETSFSKCIDEIKNKPEIFFF